MSPYVYIETVSNLPISWVGPNWPNELAGLYVRGYEYVCVPHSKQRCLKLIEQS